jgi:hypothetical protein
MNGACFIRDDSKTTTNSTRLAPFTNEQRPGTSQGKPPRSFLSFGPTSASTVSIRISAKCAAVAPHTDAHATSVPLLSLLYYIAILTPVLTYTYKLLHPLSANTPLTALYLSLIPSFYALFLLAGLDSFSPRSEWFMVSTSNT